MEKVTENKTFEVGGRKYSTIPLTGFDVLDLDRVVAAKWAEIHSRVSKSGLSTEGMSDEESKKAVGLAVANELTKIFAEMPREEYRNLIELTLSTTVAMGGKNEKNVKLSDAETIGTFFAGHVSDLHEVLIAVWEANRLSPFA